MLQDIYNVIQASEELQENRRTVSYWCLTGKLKATKLGRDYVIMREDLEAFKLAREEKKKKK